MYLPRHFEEQNPHLLQALIAESPLATLIVPVEGMPLVNHIPFLLDTSRGPYGTLCAHVARANPVWRHLTGKVEVMIVFHGPQAYISPNAYPSKMAHGKVVPTWNYAVVHAFGCPHIIEGREWLLAHVSAASAQFEANQVSPWRPADAPSEYIHAMLGAIVGIEVPVARLEGKFKLSQNRSDADREGVVSALSAGASGDPLSMAELMRRYSVVK